MEEEKIIIIKVSNILKLNHQVNSIAKNVKKNLYKLYMIVDIYQYVGLAIKEITCINVHYV